LDVAVDKSKTVIEIQNLKAHWKSLILMSSYSGSTGIDRLSVDIGRTSSYLRGLLNNNSFPKVDVIIALAKKLHRSADELLDPSCDQSAIAQQIGRNIGREISEAMTERMWLNEAPLTGKDVMRWWNENGGRLENYSNFDERFDLYEAPSTSGHKIIPHKLGKGSLATQSLGAGSPELLEETIAPLGPNFSKHILKAHQSSIDTGPVMTMETLDAAHPNNGKHIKIQYLRTLAPVILPDNTTCVLNYSELIG
jgi:hypothetical protein